MTMLATWNVNSIRVRLSHVTEFLQSAAPDVLVLQETKCEAADFPRAAFAQLGYASEAVGQKAYNGVAVLSRLPFEVVDRCLPGMDDNQARYIGIKAAGMMVGGLYLPNGNSGGEEGYRYKLAWMDCLNAHAAALLAAERPAVLLGDFNVCPQDVDYAQGTLAPDDALVRPETRRRFRALIWAGYTDALRAVQPEGKAYTFWDYQAGAWPRDRGLRIDHALLSPVLADRLISVRRHAKERALPQPSDHIPVVIDLENS